MKALIQRVSRASVAVDGETVGSIGRGLLIFLGVAAGDSVENATQLAERCRRARIFPDASSNMNLDVTEVDGSVLVVSQFTLYADTSKGRRPSFTRAAKPELAERLYLCFCRALENSGLVVETGSFGAMMEVSLVNDGPVTLLYEV